MMVGKRIRLVTTLWREFDHRFYQRQYGGRTGGRALSFLNYLRYLRVREREPNEWFSPADYWLLNKDVLVNQQKAFLHYLDHGRQEGRSYKIGDRPEDDYEKGLIRPHFDGKAYLELVYPLLKTNMSVLDHYYGIGSRLGLPPNRDFDSARYLVDHQDVLAAGVEPYFHFLAVGKKEGRRVVPAAGFSLERIQGLATSSLGIFDPAYYRRQAGLASDRTDLETFLHYHQIGRYLLARPCAWFDPNYYALGQGLPPEEAFFHFILQGRQAGVLASDPGDLDPHVLLSIRQNLDIGHYRNQSGYQGPDPGAHYLTTGRYFDWEPEPGFLGAVYLYLNEDVRIASVEPYYHFINEGRKEGRQSTLHSAAMWGFPRVAHQGPRTPSALELLSEDATLRRSFDADYYLRQNPDVSEVGIEPFQHWLLNGWKEGRNPNPWFDTSYYLEANPDVKESGMNPLLHFLDSGKEEGRSPSHPGGPRYYHFLQTLREKKEGDRKPRKEGSDLEGPEVRLESLVTDKTVLVLCHDRYTENTGGIQTCIQVEQEVFCSQGYRYLVVAPLEPRSSLASDTEERGWVFSDGVRLGWSDLGQWEPAVLKRLEALIVHSPLGHRWGFILDCAEAVGPSRSFFWLHDYFLLCPSINLLRNTIEFCGLPSETGTSCRICFYGEERRKNLGRFIQSDLGSKFQFLTPSESAKELFLRSKLFAKANIRVIEHLRLVEGVPVSRFTGGRPLQVAFVGFPSVHKGYPLFADLVNRVSDPAVTFWYIGGADDLVELPVRKARYRRGLGADLGRILEDNSIDLVLLPSVWPETFCLVALEVLQAGVSVVTLADSGNLARFADQYPGVTVLSQEGFRGLTVSDLRQMAMTGGLRYQLEWSRLTLEGMNL